VYTCWAFMPTTKNKWSPSSLFQIIFLRKVREEKHFPSSIDPRTWTIASCTNFTHSSIVFYKTGFACSNLQSLVGRLITWALLVLGGNYSIAWSQLWIIAHLKMICCSSNLQKQGNEPPIAISFLANSLWNAIKVF